MEFECPYCKQYLESDSLAPDSEFCCPSCKKTFRLDSLSNKELKSVVLTPDMPVDIGKRNFFRKHLDRIFIILYRILILSCICFATYILLEIKDDVSSIKYDVNWIESSARIIKSDVSTIESDVSEIESAVSEIESDVGTIKSDVSELESDVGTIKSDVRNIENEVSSKFGSTLRSAVEKIKDK
jgi:outer membrane murein-binding lipoprotein Lpp/uncharacterized protein YbaR (Trm112 family)